MTLLHELGDPVHEALAREERTDHYHARALGQWVLLLADALVRALEAQRQLPDAAMARRDIFHVLATRLYGNATIDVPDFTSDRSLDAMRRGRANTEGET